MFAPGHQFLQNLELQWSRKNEGQLCVKKSLHCLKSQSGIPNIGSIDLWEWSPGYTIWYTVLGQLMTTNDWALSAMFDDVWLWPGNNASERQERCWLCFSAYFCSCSSITKQKQIRASSKLQLHSQTVSVSPELLQWNVRNHDVMMSVNWLMF